MTTTITENPQELPRSLHKAPFAALAKRTLPDDINRAGRAPSTWAYKPVKDRTFLEHLCAIDLAPPEVYQDKPEDFDRGTVPVHPIWKENLFILSVGLAPIWIQFASYKAFPDFKWNAWGAYAFYFLGFFTFLITNVKRLHRYMVKYGTFDENVRSRDIVSDRSKDKLAWTILTAVIIRTAGPFVLAYDKNELPHFSFLSPFKIGWWLIGIDFFFYIYHRSCHEVPWLWFIHRSHHGTKHPTPLLTILADDYQEVIEIVLVPLLASALVRLNFFEAWAAVCYQIYVEMLGHSGIRAHWAHPILTPVLRPFKMELAVEGPPFSLRIFPLVAHVPTDHDLHHRYGRSGRNYGKQTRVFDRIFGTVAEREDTRGY